MRILLFLATNAAILVVISMVFQVFGLEGILQENGVDLNLQALLLMSAIIGFGGSTISLLISKWMAKRAMGVQVIEEPANKTEQWLVDTVRRQAQEAGIGMPEYMNGIWYLSLMTIGVGFIAGRGGVAFIIGGFVAYWFISPLLSVTGMFPSDAAANKHLRREQRAGYKVG